MKSGKQITGFFQNGTVVGEMIIENDPERPSLYSYEGEVGNTDFIPNGKGVLTLLTGKDSKGK